METAELQAITGTLAALLILACALGMTAQPCDDPGCRHAHQIHTERARRRRVTAEHALHRTPDRDCDRCNTRNQG